MKPSTWKDLAELLALSAVVAGLIAVVVELRQTQLGLRADAYQSRSFDAIETSWRLVQDPALELLLADFESDLLEPETLEPEERARLVNFYYVKVVDLDNEHYQFSYGLLDEDFYQTATVPQIESLAPYWRSLGVKEPRRAFAEEVDRILAGSSQ